MARAAQELEKKSPTHRCIPGARACPNLCTHVALWYLQDVERVAKELGEQITKAQMHLMIKQADLDSDDQVDPIEFYKMMRRTGAY